MYGNNQPYVVFQWYVYTPGPKKIPLPPLIMLCNRLIFRTYTQFIIMILTKGYYGWLIMHVRNNWCPPFYASLNDFHEWLNIFGIILEDICMIPTFIIHPSLPVSLQELTERLLRQMWQWVMISYVTSILTLWEGKEPTLNRQNPLKTDEMQNDHFEPWPTSPIFTPLVMIPKTNLQHLIASIRSQNNVGMYQET